MTSSENARAVASNPEREEAARSGSLTDELFFTDSDQINFDNLDKITNSPYKIN